MNRLSSIMTVCIKTLVFLLFVLGVFSWLASITAPAPSLAAHWEKRIDSETIPPINPFVKTVTSGAGGEGLAYSGERVTYTLQLRNSYTGSGVYAATIGVTDTVPLSLTVISDAITATHGAFAITGQEITWTLVVQPGSSYVLTYAVLAPTVTLPVTILNTAILYEISNDPNTPTVLTKSATLPLFVRPWVISLPLIKNDPTPVPTPTPTPKPALPVLGNHDFEQGESDWTQQVNASSGKLIYSQQQSPLVMLNGDWYAWLGGANNQTNQLSQQITLPSGYSDLRLRYLHWIQSDEDICANDRDLAEVRLNNTVIKSYQLCKTTRTFNPAKNHGWRWEVLDLAAFKGQPVTLAFWSQLNASRLSNFFVDVVQLCSGDADAPAGTVRCNDPPAP